MGASVFHVRTATTPDSGTDDIMPSHWNSAHAITFNAVGSEISGAFSNTPGGVTFGLETNGYITAGAPAGGGGITNINVSAGTTSNNLSRLTFADSNGVSFGLSGSVITATVATNYLTTARASNDGVGLNTALTANGVAWTVNSSGISLNVPAFLTTAMASNAATISNINVSAGTTSNNLSALTFNNSNGVSFGLNGSVLTATVQTNYLTTAALSNHSHGASGQNGSFAFQTLSFSNANGISFGTSAGSAITASHNALTTARASNDGVGLNTAQTNVTWTVNSSGISLNAGGYAGTGTSATNASITLNSNGLAISVAAGGGVNPAASASNGSFAFTTLNFSNANNVTFGTSAGGIITASVAAPGAAAENNWFNLTGNTSGNTTASGSTIALSGGNNITLSGTNGSVIRIDAPASSSIAAGPGISISTTGSTISIIAPALTLSYFNPQDAYMQVAGQHGQGTLHLSPMQAPNVQYDRLCLPMIFSNLSNSSGSQTLSVWAGIYTRNVSTLSLASSTSYSTAITASGTQGAYSSYGGLRLVTIGSTNTLTEGQYWFGLVSRTTSGGANATISQALCSQMNSTFSGVFGETSNASHQYTRGLGYYSASTTAMPNSIAFSEIRGNSSLALRRPIYYFVSGTM